MRRGAAARRVASGGEGALYAVVGYEEEGGAGGGAEEGAADAFVDAAEAAGLEEAGGGLEAGFQGVEGVEGGVYCCACYCACLEGLGWVWCGWVWEISELWEGAKMKYGLLIKEVKHD